MLTVVSESTIIFSVFMYPNVFTCSLVQSVGEQRAVHPNLHHYMALASASRCAELCAAMSREIIFAAIGWYEEVAFANVSICAAIHITAAHKAHNVHVNGCDV